MQNPFQNLSLFRFINHPMIIKILIKYEQIIELLKYTFIQLCNYLAKNKKFIGACIKIIIELGNASKYFCK